MRHQLKQAKARFETSGISFTGERALLCNTALKIYKRWPRAHSPNSCRQNHLEGTKEAMAGPRLLPCSGFPVCSLSPPPPTFPSLVPSLQIQGPQHETGN